MLTFVVLALYLQNAKNTPAKTYLGGGNKKHFGKEGGKVDDPKSRLPGRFFIRGCAWVIHTTNLNQRPISGEEARPGFSMTRFAPGSQFWWKAWGPRAITITVAGTIAKTRKCVVTSKPRKVPCPIAG